MKRSIKLSWYYPHPPEVVWQALTDPEKLRQWSGLHRSGGFRAEVGCKWTEVQRPRKGWDGRIYLEVLEVRPLQKLSYSFRGGPAREKITLDTVVTWTLIQKGDGTELRLEHAGFEGIKGLVTSLIMQKGWGKHFARKLMDYLKNDAHEYSQL